LAGITPAIFFSLTWTEYVYCIFANKKRQYEKWCQTRLIAYSIVAVNSGESMKDILEWMPLEGDNVEEEDEELNKEFEERWINNLPLKK